MKSLNITTPEPADSLNKIESELSTVIEKFSTTPLEVLLSDLLDKTVTFGLKLLAAVLIYIIGAWLIKKIIGLLGGIFQKRNVEAAIASFVQSIVSIALTVMLIIMTVGTLGIDTTSIAALLAGGGMAIGMALNGTVQNFAGGIMILIFRPFRSGDYIQVQGYEGTVSEINIVSTKLMTTDNKCIIIPNGILSNGAINNLSYNTIRRVDITVDVEYGTDSDIARNELFSLIQEDERVLTVGSGAPADPFVALCSLGSSSIQFVMRLWVRKEDYWDVNFKLTEKIYKRLPEKGIQFPYQKIDVNIFNGQQQKEG